MKIKELIAELQKHDPEKMVVVSGYEGGYGDSILIQDIRLNLNVNTKWYYGKHESSEDGEIHAVLIG